MKDKLTASVTTTFAEPYIRLELNGRPFTRLLDLDETRTFAGDILRAVAQASEGTEVMVVDPQQRKMTVSMPRQEPSTGAPNPTIFLTASGVPRVGMGVDPAKSGMLDKTVFATSRSALWRNAHLDNDLWTDPSNKNPFPPIAPHNESPKPARRYSGFERWNECPGRFDRTDTRRESIAQTRPDVGMRNDPQFRGVNFDRTGKNWTTTEDRMLRRRYAKGVSLRYLAVSHHREPEAILYRLEKLLVDGSYTPGEPQGAFIARALKRFTSVAVARRRGDFVLGRPVFFRYPK